MAQHNWAYTSESGKQYVVGLYHGVESGHLMVYCDLRIILIEFSILQDYTYSFFIENEMLDLTIKRKDNEFQYGFQVNKEVDTPRNRKRKVQEKQERRWMSVALVVMGILGILFLGAWWYNEVRSDDNALEKVRYSSWKTPAKVFVNQGNTLQYSFVADGKGYQAKMDHPEALLFPLESGDEFMVRYDFDNPNLNVLDFQLPTPSQITRYRQRAAAQHLRLHPDLDKKQVECLLDIAFEIKGLAGYADFYFQQTNPQENSRHNKESYGRLTRDIPFQKAAKLCQ
ncbi:MAG: hypothetical protein ACK4TA_18145 [Saprospiraceae bacterium]